MSVNEKVKHGDFATLLFSCPQQVGTVAAVAHFFSQHNINIQRLEEHTDADHFFSRWQWQLNSDWLEESDFNKEFEGVSSHFKGDFSVRFSTQEQSLGLLVGDLTHSLIKVLSRQETGYFPHTEISFIISANKAVRDIADRYAVPYFEVDWDDDASEQKQLEIVHRYRPNFLGLPSHKRVLSSDFLQKAGCSVINIQNAFVPPFSGPQAFEDAYARGVKLIVASAQFAAENMDDGPIIEQDVAHVASAVSVQEMIKYGQVIEQKVFSRALRKVLEHKVIVHQNRTIIFS